MKTRSLVLIGVMVIALAAMAMPVMAGQTAAVYGNIEQSCGIDTNTTDLNMIFIGSTGTNVTLGLIPNCNTPFTVGIADSSGRAGGLTGYMSNYTTSFQSDALATKLGSQMTVASQNNATANADGASAFALTTSAQTLFTGKSANYKGMLDSITFTQPVSGGDVRLPAGSTYRINMQFSITAT